MSGGVDEDPIGEVGPKSAAVFSGALGGARVLIELRRMYAARKDSDTADLPTQVGDELSDRELADAWWREQNPDWDRAYQELLDRNDPAKQPSPTAADRAESRWRNEVDRPAQPGAADRVTAAAETWQREVVLADTRGRDPHDLPNGWTDPIEYERKAREFGFSQEAHDSFTQWHAAALAEGKTFHEAADQGRAALLASVVDQLHDYKLHQNSEQETVQEATGQQPLQPGDEQVRSGYESSMLATDSRLEAAEAGWAAHQAAHDAASDWQMKLPAQEWQNAADQAYQVAHERVAGEPDASRPTPSDTASEKSLAIGTAYGDHFADKHADGWRAHMDDGQTEPPKFEDLNKMPDVQRADRADNQGETVDVREHNTQLADSLRLSELDTDYQLRDDLRSMLGTQMQASTGDTPMHMQADAAARAAYVETINNFQPAKTPAVTAHELGTESAGDAWRSVWNSAGDESAVTTSADSVSSQIVADAEPAMPGGSADSQPDASAQEVDGEGSGAASPPAKDAAWIDQAFPEKTPDLSAAPSVKPSGTQLPTPTQIKPPTTGRGA